MVFGLTSTMVINALTTPNLQTVFVYISEAGGRGNGKLVFGFITTFAGLLISIILFVYAHILSLNYINQGEKSQLPLTLRLVAICQSSSLAVLGIFSVYEFFVIHMYAAGFFFCSSIVTIFLIATCNKQEVNNETANGSMSLISRKYWILIRRMIKNTIPLLVLPYLYSVFYGKTLQAKILGAFCQYTGVLFICILFYSLHLEFTNYHLVLVDRFQAQNC
ncbi:hypothetical protein RCL1_005529 [Eukaryota sp. TZLM3-RCL]